MSQKNTCPDFIKGATNVYRTKNYIVKQRIELKADMQDDNILISYDTYYARTPKRDKQYEYGFSDKLNMDGKRMRTSMYSRRYVK